MSDAQKGRRTAVRTQSSEAGAKEPVGHGVDKRALSNQKIYLLPTIHEGAEDSTSSQEGAECPGGGISSDYETLPAMRVKWMKFCSLLRSGGPSRIRITRYYFLLLLKFNENKLFADFRGPYKIKGPISSLGRRLSGLRGSMQDLAGPIQGLRRALRT